MIIPCDIQGEGLLAGALWVYLEQKSEVFHARWKTEEDAFDVRADGHFVVAGADDDMWKMTAAEVSFSG